MERLLTIRNVTNANSVSIELCDIATKYPSDAQVKATKECVAYIQSKCPNAKTIIRHWDVSGKSCPKMFTGTNNDWWNKLKKAITPGSSTSTSSSSSSKSTSSSTTSKSSSLTVDGSWGQATTKKASESPWDNTGWYREQSAHEQ